MRHHSRVVHAVHGRVRVKVPNAKQNPRLLTRIKESLAPIDGVHNVSVQPATGTFTVQYSGCTPSQFQNTLTEHGRSTGLFELAPPELSEVDALAQNIEREARFLASRSELARSAVDAVGNVNQWLKRATDNNLDLKVLLPLGLAIYSFLEVESEISTPLWVTLGIFSFNSFVALHPPLPEPSSRTPEPPLERNAW
jgi:Heavy metal associated domain 2